MVEIEEVILGLKQGRQASLKQLYTYYSAALYGIVHRILLSDVDAEEILQDVFVKIWKNIDSFNSEKATLYTWMATIARNAALDRKRLKSFSDQQNTVSLDHQNHNQSTESSSLGISIPKLTQNMPEKYRVLVEKMFVFGYTQQEIADEMEMPLGTVKTRLREAISMIRKDLNNERHLLYMLSLI